MSETERRATPAELETCGTEVMMLVNAASDVLVARGVWDRLVIAIARRVRKVDSGLKLNGPERVAVANLLHRALEQHTAASSDYTLWDSAWRKILADSGDRTPHA